jgi:hypothetical protein
MTRYKLDKEGSILAGVTVRYKSKEYVTGNRYHDLVELYKNGKFQFVVKFLKNHTFRRL